MQQRVWNLFGKDKIFGELITHDLIFELMSKLLILKFIAVSYCANSFARAPGQELHIDYPYWDFYEDETFPDSLNGSFLQNCQATIPLDVCSNKSGATAFIPGSEKLKYPNKNDDFSKMEQMIANPGDLDFLMAIVGMVQCRIIPIIKEQFY